jgi:hypothetical protein
MIRVAIVTPSRAEGAFDASERSTAELGATRC